MSATYNWAYKPGIINKYGLTVPAGSDNARPAGYGYVALFGNDVTGNGSRQYPYRTLTKALATLPGDCFIILGSGTYREAAILTGATSFSLVGDGDVVLDISYNNGFVNYGLSGIGFYNLRIVGSGSTGVSTASIGPTRTFLAKDVVFDGCFAVLSNTYADYTLLNCVVSNYSGSVTPNDASVGTALNCTFVNCASIIAISTFVYTSCIFSVCNISGATQGTIRYSLFSRCNFRINAAGSGGVLYPSFPAGYTYYSDIALLKAAYFAAYAALSYKGCTIASPLFNNEVVGDYTLAFNSPAKNLSYFGTYVGARSIAQGLKIRAVEADGDFDFSTAVNVNIADDSLTLTDTSQDAIIETKVIENVLGRQLKSIPIVGFNADRNGQYIDSIADLDTVTKAAGNTLAVPASYMVEIGAITYNSVIYTPGQRFTTITGQTIFSTVASGVVREILEAPQRHTIEMMLSDVQPFTTEVYNHFEPGITPTTNNVGDARTGAILRGNGDPAFVRGSAVEFPVNSKYVKIRFTIRANNLRP